MFARFNENPTLTLQDIKETNRYGRTDNVKTVYPLQTKFAGGIIIPHGAKIGPALGVTCFTLAYFGKILSETTRPRLEPSYFVFSIT